MGTRGMQYIVAHEMIELCGIVFLTLGCYEHMVRYYEHLDFKRNQIHPTQHQYDTPLSMKGNLNVLANRLFDLEKSK